MSYAPNELIIKPGDPALFMYTIRRGLAAKAGAIMAAGMYFGDDFLLASFFRPYTVRALTFLDCFRMDRTVLFQLFQYGQFPLFQVCAQGTDKRCAQRSACREILTPQSSMCLTLSHSHTLPFAETNWQVAHQDDPAVQAGPVRQGSTVRTRVTSHAPTCDAPSLASACMHAAHLSHLLSMHCVACVCPRMFRKATYKGENFEKAVNEFVKESTNHSRSVRLQRETVYHMYASPRKA